MPARRREPALSRDKVFALDEHCCVYCAATENLTVDHVIPLYHGGPHALWNLATACGRCNSGKQHRFSPAAARVLVENVTHCFVQRSRDAGWGPGEWHEKVKAKT